MKPELPVELNELFESRCPYCQERPLNKNYPGPERPRTNKAKMLVLRCGHCLEWVQYNPMSQKFLGISEKPKERRLVWIIAGAYVILAFWGLAQIMMKR